MPQTKSPIPLEIREKAWRKKYRQTHPDYYRTVQLRKLYGLSRDDYNALATAQGNRCAVCGNHEHIKDSRSGKVRELSVDHDHATGRVRSLLCDRCNRTLGLLQENPDLIRDLAAYIEAWRG